jgi:glycogen debranching enzyme
MSHDNEETDALGDPQPRHLVRLRTRAETLYVSQNRTVLATRRDGFINAEPDHGFFVRGTRLLSRYEYRLNGNALLPNALSNVEQHTWLGYYVAPAPDARDDYGTQGPGGAAAQQTIEVRLSRFVSDGLHEDVDVTNFTQQAADLALDLILDADFADIAETRGQRLQRGKIATQWNSVEAGHALTFSYDAEHTYSHQGNVGTARLQRGVTVRFRSSSSPPTQQRGTVRCTFLLEPQATWHMCVDILPLIDGEQLSSQYRCRSFAGGAGAYDTKRRVFLRDATRVSTPTENTLAPVVIGALEQAKRDLGALRLHDFDHGRRAWTVAAGLPVYVSLFGRDTLTAAWQAAMASQEMMPGTLAELARWQGKEVNDWRDEQPGKMLHQAESGPLAVLNVNPLGRYYGSITTSGFYPVIVSELWHWTGDKDLVQPFIEPGLKALRWLDEYADLDRDGFYEYQTRSEQGTRNQGWKDSEDAIVHEDGSQAAVPIATSEEQGFVYLAKLHLAELLWWLDRKEEAHRLYHEAGELKKRFNRTFWMDDVGFLAMALDAEKRPVKSIGSNAGHCLATGIVEEAFVIRTAERLFEDDMFSGWGIRTLSDRHRAYNPYSYHRGSVWPVEHGSFAIGFARYGLHEHVERICRAQFEAASLFDFYRLPELFTGHQRDQDHPFPAYYPNANSPQAWSASAVWCLLQTILGLYPYAPLNLLIVDPHLPVWLPEITVKNLHVGAAVIDMRFHRTRSGESDYQVLAKRGPLHVVRQPSPWSLTATFGERLQDALHSLLP